MTCTGAASSRMLSIALVILGFAAVSAAPAAAQWTKDGQTYSGWLVSDGATGVVAGGGASTSRHDSAGVRLWGPTNFATATPAIVSDGAGGIIAVYNSGGSWVASRINNSMPYWVGVTVRAGLPMGTSNLSVCSDGAGGVIAAWSENRSGSFDIYAQRIDASGMPIWPANGTAVCTATGAQDYPSVVSDGANGAIVVWQDYRPLIMTEPDIYAQRIHAFGMPQWTGDGVPVCVTSGAQDAPVAVSDGAGGVIAAWPDSRSFTTKDIYAQRLNGSGAPQWGMTGAAVVTGAGDQVLPALVADGGGGAFVAWEDHRNFGMPPLDVYAQRMGSGGTTQWTAGGVPVCTNFLAQARPQMVTDGAGGVVIAWEDSRLGSAVGALQRLDAGGVAQWTADGVVIANVALSSPLPLAPDNAGGAYIGLDKLFRVTNTGVPAWIASYTARITAVSDEPADEGGSVRLAVTRPLNDGGSLGATVTAYNVWRLVPPSAAALGTEALDVAAIRDRVARGLHAPVVIGATEAAPVGFPPGTWESLGSHYATQSPTYLFSAATRADSVSGGPPATETYVVTAHTTDPSFFTVSAAATGYSVDNLPPTAPQNVAGQVYASLIHIEWSANPESDLAGYSVYRGTTADFTPAPGNRIGQPTTTELVDTEYDTGVWFYKVTARDRHGNESAASLLTDVTTGIGDRIVPERDYLAAAAPNPAPRGTTIEYGLARGGRVSLAAFDAAGRRVRSLIAGTVGPGVWRLRWDGADDAGRKLAAGVYLIRLSAPGVEATSRVVLAD